ncbi:hypothetical protein IIC38_20130 [candidate division KSB1 bacterium]|nr:hypothetical protein [candidate division KSB1 bacterium]
MEHFLEEHYWVTGFAVLGFIVLSGIAGTLVWRLHKIRKKYDGVFLNDLSTIDLELIMLFRAAPDHLKAEVLQEDVEQQNKSGEPILRKSILFSPGARLKFQHTTS